MDIITLIQRKNSNALNGVLQFVNATKPYHTHVLDIELNYSYTEKMVVSLSEKSMMMDIELTESNTPLTYDCNSGYGLVWDDETSAELFPTTTIKTAVAPEIVEVAPFNFSGSPSLTQTLNVVTNATPNYFLVGTEVTFQTTDTFPTTVPQIVPGVPYTVIDSSITGAPTDYITVALGATTILFSDAAFVGTLSVVPINSNINSFLIDSVVGITYNFTADPTTNTLTFTTPRPRWPNGTKVNVWSSGTLPSPLLSTTSYYAQPIAGTERVQLSYVRYPIHSFEYVDLTDMGTGTLSIQREESFYNGQRIQVSSSYGGYNDDTYNVLKIVRESPTTERVFVLGRVVHHTPTSLFSDGVMAAPVIGFSESSFCPVASMSNMHVEAALFERLQITIDNALVMYLGGTFDTL